MGSDIGLRAEQSPHSAEPSFRRALNPALIPQSPHFAEPSFRRALIPQSPHSAEPPFRRALIPQVVTPLIQRRIEQYSSKEIRFNLMAVVADRRVKMTEQQAVVEKERNMTVGKVQARGGKVPTQAELERLCELHPPPPPMGEVAVDERCVDELVVALAHCTRRAAQIQSELDLENAKVMQWKVENRRRKHNYVPFIVGFLEVLAKKGARWLRSWPCGAADLGGIRPGWDPTWVGVEGCGPRPLPTNDAHVLTATTTTTITATTATTAITAITTITLSLQCCRLSRSLQVT